MGFNFPNAPITGQLYPAVVTPGMPQYRYDGEKWRTLVAVAGTASVFVSDTPPVAPTDGMLWWESDTGNLYVRYNDGDSTQWVIVGQYGTLNGLLRYDVDQTGTITTAQKQQARQNVWAAPYDAMMYNNLVINGGMDVDQEAIGLYTLVTGAPRYILDGWLGVMISSTAVVKCQRSLMTGNGLNISNSFLMNCTTGAALAAGDLFFIYQPIEGLRVAKGAWGSAAAMPLTISFLLYSTIAGTFAVSIRNGVTANRSYIVNCTHNVANTWQSYSVTIPGDQAGTWQTNNTESIRLAFCFGAGSTYQCPAGVWTAGGFVASPQTTNFFATAQYVHLSNVHVAWGTDILTPPNLLPRLQKHYNDQLLECLRYFVFIPNVSIFGSGTLRTGGNAGYGHVSVPVPMCRLPSLSNTGLSGLCGDNTIVGVSAVSIGSGLITDLNVSCNFSASMGANANAFMYYQQTGVNAFNSRL